MPRRAIAGVSSACTSFPSKRIVPAEARQSPMMVRRHVVLPAPLRPRSMVREFGATLKATPCRMWYCPMCVWIALSSKRSGTRDAPERSARDTQVSLLDDRHGDHLGRCAFGHELP